MEGIRLLKTVPVYKQGELKYKFVSIKYIFLILSIPPCIGGEVRVYGFDMFRSRMFKCKQGSLKLNKEK